MSYILVRSESGKELLLNKDKIISIIFIDFPKMHIDIDSDGVLPMKMEYIREYATLSDYVKTVKTEKWIKENKEKTNE